MADWASESSSNSVLAFSDTDIETINTEELVIFDSTQTFYSTKKDIVVTYASGNAVENSPRDWVGLFKGGWQTVLDFSAYQWVPLDPLSAWESRRRRTIFPQADIEILYGDFQFLYVNGDQQVIGVSETVQLSDFDPIPLSSLLSRDTLPQSLSLISLGSSSASSEENECEEETSDEKKCASEQQPLSKPVFTEPEVTTVSLRNDNWTLSDFVIGNNSRTIYEKLRFAETFEPKDLVDEYEPLKQFYLSLRKRHNTFVEEVGTDNSELAPIPRAGDDVVSSGVPVCDKPIVKTVVPPMTIPAAPLMYSFWREHFHRSCLEYYRQKLMEPALEENEAAFRRRTSAKDAHRSSNEKPEDGTEQFPRWVLPMSSLREVEDGFNDGKKDEVSSFAERCLQSGKTQKQPSLTTRRREPEEHDENAATGSAIGTARAAVVPLSESTLKQMAPVVSRNLRKKRSVNTSRSKTNRGNRDAMLEEALALLTTPQPSVGPTAETSAASESSFSGAAPSARAHSKPGSRKRPSKAAAGIGKAKRRRLGLNKSSANPNPCKAEDGGHSDDEDEEGKLTFNSARETLALLSQALAEALQNNAELRLQLRRAKEKRATETDKRNAASNAAVVMMKKDDPSQCVKAATTGKAVNTEKRKKCNASANTATVAKKDTPSQCNTRKTKGKATNTDKKEKRHAASNTAVVTKKDTPSQCVAPKTAGKSTNTALLSSKTDTGNNTVPVQMPDSSVQCSCNKTDGVKTAQSKTAALNAVLRTPESETSSNPEVSLEKWRTVASKKMVRLRQMIAKKRAEFARLKENSENYEKRTQTLEAQLRSVRSALSTESSNRLKAEEELREVRIKFWELLAARKSQTWAASGRAYDAPDRFSDGPKPLPVKPVIISEPFFFQTPDVSPLKVTSEVNNEHTLLTRLPDSGEVFPGMAIRFTASTGHPYTSNESEKKSSKNCTNQTGSSDEDRLVDDMARCAEILPLVSTAQFKNVAVRAEQEKKASSSAISFKKFLMPAMTAIAETFSSSKSRHKLAASGEHVTLTTTTKSPDCEPSAGAVAKVTVSISAGLPSSKSSPTLQKTESKSKKSKRSSSKGKTKAENCKPPREETTAQTSADVNLRRRPETAPSKPKTSERSTRTPSSSFERSVPKVGEMKPVENFTDVGKSPKARQKVAELSEKADAETAEWRPLVIPLGVCAESDDADRDGPATSVQPVKFRFAKQKSAGKGRPFNYGPVTGRSRLFVFLSVSLVCLNIDLLSLYVL